MAMSVLEFLISLQQPARLPERSASALVNKWLIPSFSNVIQPSLLNLYFSDFESFEQHANSNPLDLLAHVQPTPGLINQVNEFLLDLVLSARIASQLNHLENFITHFTEDGLSFQTVPGDGDCLFRAIAVAMGCTGSNDHVRHVRQAVHDQATILLSSMQTARQSRINFHDCIIDSTWLRNQIERSLILNPAGGGGYSGENWGDENHIFLAATAFNTPIVVVSGGGNQRHLQINPNGQRVLMTDEELRTNLDTVVLIAFSAQHYTPVINQRYDVRHQIKRNHSSFTPNGEQLSISIDFDRLIEKDLYDSDPEVVKNLLNYLNIHLGDVGLVSNALASKEGLRECANTILTIYEGNLLEELGSMLVEIGVRLIYSDEELVGYRENGDIRHQVAQLLKNNQYRKLVQPDEMYYGLIEQIDIQVESPNGRVSGSAVITGYFDALEQELTASDNLDFVSYELDSVTSDERQKTLSIPKANGHEQAIINILKSQHLPQYRGFLVSELLPKLSEIARRLVQVQLVQVQSAREQKKEASYAVRFYALLDEIANHCSKKRNLFEVFQLVLYYTRKSSKNREVGGVGEDGWSDPDWTYKAQQLFSKCWIEWCDETTRNLLIRNCGFRNFFNVITNRGILFGSEQEKYYHRYWRRTNEIDVLGCTDVAQNGLNRCLRDQSIAHSLRKASKKRAYVFIETTEYRNIAAAKLIGQRKQELLQFVQLVKRDDLTTIAADGCTLDEHDNQFFLLDIKSAISQNKLTELELLVERGTQITTSLLSWVSDQRDLNENILDYLVSHSIYRDIHPCQLVERYQVIERNLPPIVLRKGTYHTDFNYNEMIALLKQMKAKCFADLESITLLLDKLTDDEQNHFIENHLVELSQNGFEPFRVQIITAVLLKVSPQQMKALMPEDYSQNIDTWNGFSDFIRNQKVFHYSAVLKRVSNQIGLSDFLIYKDLTSLNNYKRSMLSALNQATQSLSNRLGLKNSLSDKKRELENLKTEVNQVDLLSQDDDSKFKELDLQAQQITKKNRSTFFKVSKTKSFIGYSSVMSSFWNQANIKEPAIVNDKASPDVFPRSLSDLT